MKKFGILIVSLGLLLSSSLAAQPVEQPVRWSESHALSTDGISEIVLKGTIDEGWHIYPLELDEGITGYPTSVTLSEGARMVENPVMTGDFGSSVIIRFKAEFPDEGGTVTVEWQACSDSMCLPPADESFTFEQGKSAPVEEKSGGKSIWKIILEAIAWGFVALLTPCVFPMIPMTVSFFLKQNERHKGRGRFLAAAFGTFIVALYTLPIAVIILVTYLAGGAAVTADIFNWIATHWLPNILFFLIFMLFAASFFGAFEIVLPSRIVNSSDRKSNRGGLGGVFFVALTLVLVSFSCTGPIVGSVLIKSTQGQFWEPIVTMFAFSVAFALPFTVLAFAPSLLKKLPKSGSWLNSVKVVLGFIELALGFKFLSVADQTYHWGILDREVYLAIWIVIFSLLGLYLLGKIRFRFDSPLEHISVFRLALIIIDFTFVVYMIPGMWGAPLKALSGYLPPITTQDFNLDLTQRTAPSEKERKYADFLEMPYGIEAFYDYEQARQYAIRENKPLLIDFTGHGCVNCREMESRVWSDPRVLSMMKNDYVICALFADDKKEVAPEDWITTDDGKVLKTLGKINSHFALTRFNVNAQPYYAILDPASEQHKVPSRGYNLNVGEFVEFLQSGLN